MENEDELLCMKTDDEEQTHNSSSNGGGCASNSGNGRYPKKKKEKDKPVKIQQRGLGVAELEKIRLAEERKNKGVVLPSSPIITPMPASNLYNRSASVPLRPPFVTQTQLPNHIPYNNYYAYVPHNPHLNGSSQMSSEYIQELEKLTRPAAHKTNTSEGPNMMGTFPVQQIANQQSHFYPPSTVNHVAANSSSAVLGFEAEPPSNQSLYGNYTSVQLNEAEKTVGTKRPYIFSPQDQPDPSAHCKFNSFTAHNLGGSTSFGTQGSFAINGTPSLREGLPCSMSMPNSQQGKDTKTDCATSDGGSLKLGPSVIMSLLPSSESKQALSYAHTHQAELDTVVPYRAHAQGSNSHGGSKFSTNHQQQGPYSLPASNNPLYGQSTVSSNHKNGESEDNVNLNLEL